MKRWIHKLKHWEYWSHYVIYAPTFFVWLLLMLRFRSIRFFKYANPGIKNGGFYGDSKFAIYQLLPKGTYPKTVLVHHDTTNDYEKTIKNNDFKFPLILKPDVGLRGINVKKVYSVADVVEYSQKVGEDFLIQELIELPNEMGLFYCRLPNNKKGMITGITLKKYLTLNGNGKNTMEELLCKNPRFEMQISTLKHQIDLSEVLPDGAQKCLVPYGNHNRGTEFLDGKRFISNELTQTFDGLLSSVDGFYFGRLDIKYNTMAELEKGINFSIIELNGVKSEPTHIYDPKHSFWYGQKEIFRHQKIMYKIIKIASLKSGLG